MSRGAKGPEIQHGACHVEEWPDGRFVVYFWNANLRVWTFEHPDESRTGGCAAMVWWTILVLAVVATFWTFH